jgi:hypothetical protein
MEDSKSDVSVSRNKKLKNVMRILLPLLLIAFPIFYILHGKLTTVLAFLTWFLIIITTVISVILSRKYYNWIFIFLLIIITAFYFRSYRIPPWHLLLVVGFSGLACVSFYSSFFFLRDFNHNIFLKYIGFTSGIILTAIFLGLLWKMMHWVMAGIFQAVGMILFFPYLFAFVLLLPGSNYVSWSKPDRTIFFRVIIIPMIFIYALCVIMYALPGIWASFRTPITPFGMFPLELLDKPGI